MRQVDSDGGKPGERVFHSARSLAVAIACMALLAACANTPATADDTVVGPPVPPRVIGDTQECKPIFPAEAKRNGHQGRVEMRVLVDISGRAAKAEIVRPSGFPLLDQAALGYTKCMRFAPGHMDDRPVAMWASAPVNFILRDTRPPAAGWASTVAAAIRQHIIYPDAETIPGNPSVEFEIVLAPDGMIVGQRITRSSGFPAWDRAASLGITKTERLPPDLDGKVLPMLTVTLRPRPVEP